MYRAPGMWDVEPSKTRLGGVAWCTNCWQRHKHNTHPFENKVFVPAAIELGGQNETLTLLP